LRLQIDCPTSQRRQRPIRSPAQLNLFPLVLIPRDSIHATRSLCARCPILTLRATARLAGSVLFQSIFHFAVTRFQRDFTHRDCIQTDRARESSAAAMQSAAVSRKIKSCNCYAIAILSMHANVESQVATCKVVDAWSLL
jgi:hypothetical protein